MARRPSLVPATCGLAAAKNHGSLTWVGNPGAASGSASGTTATVLRVLAAVFGVLVAAATSIPGVVQVGNRWRVYSMIRLLIALVVRMMATALTTA